MSVLDDVALVADARGATAAIRPGDGRVRLTFPDGSVKTLTLDKVMAAAARLRGLPEPPKFQDTPRVYRYTGPM